MREDYSDLVRGLVPCVLAAGERLMHHFGTEHVVDMKSDGSPVSIADREAEMILLDGLRQVAPDIAVVAEEAAASGSVPQVGDRFFLVDPLDGTKEFVSGREEFTVNIGLVVDGVPRFGVVFAPALGRLYLTVSDRRALCVDGVRDGSEQSVSEKRVSGLLDRGVVLATRAKVPLEGASVVSSRSHGSPALEDWLSGVRVAQRLKIGSSLKFCLIAQGDGDIYPRFGPTKEWDTAAGHAIVLAAGGVVTLEDGKSPLLYGKQSDDFLNPNFIVWGAR